MDVERVSSIEEDDLLDDSIAYLFAMRIGSAMPKEEIVEDFKKFLRWRAEKDGVGIVSDSYADVNLVWYITYLYNKSLA